MRQGECELRPKHQRECFCGKNLEFTEYDTAEHVIWFSCPEYTNGNDEHGSLSCELKYDSDGNAITDVEEYFV